MGKKSKPELPLKIDITSSALEKGFDVAEKFLDKLVGPTLEETGLLMKEKVASWRLGNQVSVLNKTKKICSESGIDPNHVSLKFLCPFLDQAALENDDYMQDRWAHLLANMMSSDMNIQNQIFPFLLGQVSIEEYKQLKVLNTLEIEFKGKRTELNELRPANQPFPSRQFIRLRDQILKQESDGFLVDLKGYEVANLVRLGLLWEVPPKILIEEFETGGPTQYGGSSKRHKLLADYYFGKKGYRLTELGDKFLELCEPSKMDR